MTTTTFNTIGITGKKIRHPELKLYIQKIIACLQSNNVSAQIDDVFADLLIKSNSGVKISSFKDLELECDLIIVVGGDGSFLEAARRLETYNTPIAGFNLGHLGFLTEISPETMDEQLVAILQGDFIKDERFFLEANIVRNNKVFDREIALNDVVIHPGEFARIIEYELYVDEKFVFKQQADGIIIATPTGSTAYALSAGGPVMTPKLDAIVIAPMHPHLLTNRPLVVPGDSNITIIVSKETTNLPRISCDGQVHLKSCYQDEIIINKKQQHLTLYHPPDHSFYKSCRSKLKWNSHGRKNW